jgi:hypothetical protein
MKNIHLISTDKPTGIFELNNGLHFSITNKVRYGVYKGYHIYITSDEDPKNKDYYWDENKLKVKRYFESRESFPSLLHRFKVILTTDPNLIKDGVQPIDNTFLEWFINNSSCKSVKIESWQTKGEWELEYKIIIPKEEPKQSTVGKEFYESADKIITIHKQDIIQLIEDRILSEYKKHSASLPDEWAKIAAYKIYKSISDKMENPKQHIEFINNNIEEFDDKLEQFKQASEHYAHNHFNMHETNNYKALKQGYEAGAKEMFDKMYSEEEVRKLLETQRGNCYVAILIKTRDEELAAIAGGAPEPSGYNGWVKQSKEEILEEPNISVEEVSLLMRKAPITFVPNKRIYSEVFEWLATKDYLSDNVDIIQKEFEQFKKKLI